MRAEEAISPFTIIISSRAAEVVVDIIRAAAVEVVDITRVEAAEEVEDIIVMERRLFSRVIKDRTRAANTAHQQCLHLPYLRSCFS